MLSCEGAICTGNAGDLVQRMMCGYAACARTMTAHLIVRSRTYSGRDTESMFMDVAEIVRSIGLPSVIILGIAYAFYHAATWFGREIIVPLRDRHFSFLQSLEGTLKAIAATQQSMANEMERISGMVSTCQRSGKAGAE